MDGIADPSDPRTAALASKGPQGSQWQTGQRQGRATRSTNLRLDSMWV
jgi:hypothetical protein